LSFFSGEGFGEFGEAEGVVGFFEIDDAEEEAGGLGDEVEGLNAGGSEEFLEGEVGAPAKVAAERIDGGFDPGEEGEGRAEVVDDDEVGVRFGDAEGFGEAALGIRDGGDEVGEENGIEGTVGEGEVEGVGLEELGVAARGGGADRFFVEFFLGLGEHGGAEVDAGDVDVVGVVGKGEAGADADVEDAVVAVKGDGGDGFLEALFEEEFGGVVNAAIEGVNAGGDGLGHGGRLREGASGM
jgi:hypothetical protein